MCIVFQDQKPNSPIEATRIHQMGGFVSPETKHESSRVFVEQDGEGDMLYSYMPFSNDAADDSMIPTGGLALARAIGDTIVGAVGVSPPPLLHHCRHSQQYSFLHQV